MPFNIDTFKASLENDGYLKNSHFQVAFNPPTLMGNSFNITDMIRFRAESISVPGISIQTVDNYRYGVGPTQKFAHNANFNESRITMITDINGLIYNFWHEWARGIFQHSGTEINDSRIPTYTNEYKNNYTTTIQIVVFDMYGDPVKVINLYNAFPTSINDIPMNWNDNNITKLNVSLTFSNFTIS